MGVWLTSISVMIFRRKKQAQEEVGISCDFAMQLECGY